MEFIKTLIVEYNVDPHERQIIESSLHSQEGVTFLLELDTFDASFDNWYVLRKAISLGGRVRVGVLKVILASPKVELSATNAWELLNLGYDLLILEQMTREDLILQGEEGETLAVATARLICRFGLDDDRYEVYLRRGIGMKWNRACFDECFQTLFKVNREADGFDTILSEFYHYWATDRIPMKKLAKAYYHLFSGVTKHGEGLAERLSPAGDLSFDIVLRLVPYYLT